MIDLCSRDFYRVAYENILESPRPNLNRVIAHSKSRFEQRFQEEWNGNYLQAKSTFAYLANQGLSEREMFEMVDWYFGMIADRCVHSFSLLRKLIDSYQKFIVDNKMRRRAGEDWYSYCTRIRNKTKERNQSTESLDDLILKIVKVYPQKGVF